VAIRRRRSYVLGLLFVMTSCATPDGTVGPGGSPGPAVSGASQPGPAGAAVPFADFLAGVRSARYGDYAGKPGTAVRNEAAFEEMRRYLLDRYATARVGTSLVLGDATFDCVGAGGSGPSGNACPPGTVPVRRVTLTELVRFPTLQSFLGKDPGGGGLPPVPSPPR